jgi:hypothetical protein
MPYQSEVSPLRRQATINLILSRIIGEPKGTISSNLIVFLGHDSAISLFGEDSDEGFFRLTRNSRVVGVIRAEELPWMTTGYSSY